MFTLSVTPAATAMAGEAYSWYESQQIGLGESFLSELENAFNRLEQDPFVFAVVNKQYRQLLLRKFPYVLVFEIFDKEVLLISIFHTSRNPKKKFIK